MICKTCGIDCRLYKQIFSNGTVHITERCPVCGSLADSKRPFLRNDEVENVNSLPVWGIATDQVIANQPELPRAKPKPVYFHLGGRT